MTSRNFEICIDANDPDLLRPFWRAALGYVDEQTPEGAHDLVDPQGNQPTLWFQTVPETKTSKNRLHLDINVGGERGTPPDERRRRVDDAVERLIGLGATKLRTVEEPHAHFVVMQDPEGNEFCLQ